MLQPPPNLAKASHHGFLAPAAATQTRTVAVGEGRSWSFTSAPDGSATPSRGGGVADATTAEKRPARSLEGTSIKATGGGDAGEVGRPSMGRPRVAEPGAAVGATKREDALDSDWSSRPFNFVVNSSQRQFWSASSRRFCVGPVARAAPTHTATAV